jgi:hypothetical protein
MLRLQSIHQVHFLYNSELNLKIPYKGSDIKTLGLKQALDKVFKQNGIAYSIHGSNILLLQAPAFDVHAQFVTGFVVDKGKKPLEYANVIVYAQEDKSFIQGVVSGKDGSFTVSTNSKANVLLQVSMVGYKRYSKIVSSGSIGNIILEEDTNVLKEVSVTATLPIHKIKGSALVTKVQGSVLAKAGTAQDVIAHLPGIRQEDDNFSVIGKGTPVIYINSRRLHNLSELSRLSSADISTVEVDMNPGSKYESSVKSVIIIRTVKKIGDGFGGEIYANLRQAHSMSCTQGVDVNWRKDNVDVFGGFSYDKKNNYQKQRNNNVITTSSDSWLLLSEIKIFPKSNTFSANAGINWQIAPKHSVGMRYDIVDTPHGKSTWVTNQNANKNNDILEKIDYTTLWTRREGPVHTINAYYDGEIGKSKIKWDNDIYRSSSDAIQDISQHSSINGANMFNSDNKVTNWLFSSKCDVSMPIGKGSLDVGAEYNNTNRKDKYMSSSSSFPATDDQIKQNLWAGFLSYGMPIDKVEFSLGLRYEYTSVNYYENGTLIDEQSRTYGNLFPDVSISFPLADSKWSLSYTAKTRRPMYSELSSNLQYDDRFTYEKGNPLLKAEINHDITLESIYKWAYISASYQQIKNAIIGEILPYSTNSPINVMSNKNVNRLVKYSFVISLQPTLGIWTPNLIINMMGQKFNTIYNGNKLSLNRPLVFANLFNNFRLSHGYQFNVDMSCHNRGDMDITRLKGNWQVNLGISKSIGNWFFLLQGYDIFRSARNSMINYGSQLKFDKWNYSDSQSLKLTVRYQFNLAQSKYKGTSSGNSERNRF